MKSRDLIAELQKLDPIGDVEVCVDNNDIYFAQRMEAYWDGTLKVLIRDDSKRPYYHVAGMRYVRSGSKIKLHTMDLRDVLLDNPDAIVDTSDLIGRMADETNRDVAEVRQEMRVLIAECKAPSQKGTP